MREWTIKELINRIHSWADVYNRENRKVLSFHERDEFEEEQNHARFLIIQILEEKKG